MSRLLLVLALVVIVTSLSDAQNSIVLIGADLIDGTGTPPQPNSAIMITGKTITLVGTREYASINGKLISKIRTSKGVVDIPEDVGVYELPGKTIIPGLIDAHAHYGGDKADLVRMLSWGVTSASCMVEATDRAPALERETAPDSVEAPHLFPSSPVFSVKGGWWWGKDFSDDSTLNRFPATPADARAQIRRAKKKGLKRFTLVYDDMRWCRDSLPPYIRMKKEIMRALLDEAGRQGLTAEVESPQIKDARDVLAAGSSPTKKFPKTDTLTAPRIGSFGFAQGILGDTISTAFEQTMVSKHAFYVPTFSAFEFLAGAPEFMQHAMREYQVQRSYPDSILRLDLSAEYYNRHRAMYPNASYIKSCLPAMRRNVKFLYDHHVPIVAGSGLEVLPGFGIQLELEYLVQCGLTPIEAIAAATKMAAQFLGRESSIGTIEAGKQADLLILDATPVQNVMNTRIILKVMKQGMFYDRQDLIDRTKK